MTDDVNSSMIWSESQLQMRMDEVVKMKKEQEVFIDMTSYVNSLASNLTLQP